MQEIESRVNAQYKKLTTMLDEKRSQQFRKMFLSLHSYEQGQFFLTLSKVQRQEFYGIMQPGEVSEIFDVLKDDLTNAQALLQEMDIKYAAQMLDQMDDDNAADLLEQLDKPTVQHYLQLIPQQNAHKLRKLLNYGNETAGGLMTTDYAVLKQDVTVKDAIKSIRKFAKTAETIYYLYIVNENNDLVGIMSLRELLVHNEQAVLNTIMNRNIISVYDDDDQEQVAGVFRDYQLIALPVISHTKQMLGIVTVDDAIDVIDDEAQDDYSKLAGVDVDEPDSETPMQAAKSRLPWLITLLFLGMITATLISHFETLLSKASILAVFISLITGTAGNAGTQSLAVAVRKLSLEDNKAKHIWKLIGKECLTGLIAGFITGITIFIVVGIWKHNWILGFVIGLAMMFAIVVANLAGSLIPMGMAKLGFDPAVASGPFISTLSDLTSVLIYFNIASLFLSYFIKM